MSYIWENYKVDNEYILALKDFCPYTEIFEMVDGKANVNILYRFMNLYDILFAEIDMEKSFLDVYETGDFNILFHNLANLDLVSGLSKKDLRMMRMYYEVCEGLYGKQAKKLKQMEFVHKYKILSYMDTRKQNRCKDNIFFDCIAELFDSSIFYSEFKDTYIINIKCSPDMRYGENKLYSAKDLYDVVKKLLCDFWLNVEEYWKVPICVVGADNQIGNIQII